MSAKAAPLSSLRLAASGSPGAWISSVGIGIAAAGAEIALALSFAELARVLGSGAASDGAIVRLAGALALAAAIRVIAQVGIGYLATSASVETARALRRRGLDAILRADAHATEPASDVLTRWLEIVPRAAQAQQAVIALGAQLVQAVLLAALVIAAAPGLGAAMIAVLAATALIARAVAVRVRLAAAELAPSQRRVASILERVTRHVLEIRALRTASDERARLAAAVDDHAALQRRVAFGSALASASPILPAVLVIGALAGVALHVGIEPGRIVAMLYALVRLAALLAAAGQAFGTVAAAGPSLESIAAEAPSEEIEPAPGMRREGAAAIAIAGARVELGGRAILREVDLAIAAGERVAITGGSGVGKTTLLRLVLGLVQPSAGSVAIDGETPAAWTEAGGRVGVVGAEPLLFAGTLRENLAYGLRPPPEDAAMIAALEQVSAEALVRRGLEHPIGERGEGLSTGERQRVALARAIVGRPSLIVLDEPTSALDAELEQEIADLLRTIEGTVIVATHRPALARACDRTIELRPGDRGATLRAPLPKSA